ncbi:ABC transporter permease [Bacillus sp. T33-2]|uniref:ABC transporter permease n=1 Tax=Bacillus sp. T33-2 TaxID=2054168 RepID=UPI000C75D380|nr:ABC transporter permease [Bacillus sp. T33-2]PLR91104.1 hypothetical protein CVD19_22100 [Bacillus sp. T33-2]
MGRAEYITRLKKETQFQKKVFRMVLDWSIIVYFVFPAMVILAVIHYRMWHSPPGWTSTIPVELFGLSLYMGTLISPMRTFVAQADELFVLQKTEFYKSLIQHGKYFAVLKAFIEIGVVIVYLLPVFVAAYSISNSSIVGIFTYLFIWNIFQKLIERWFFIRRIIWRRRLFSVFSFALYGAGFYGLFHNQSIFITISSLILIAVVCLIVMEKDPIRHFQQDAEREQKEKWKWASFIMIQSGEVDSIRKTRKYPLLNKNSRPIFSERTPEKILTEMYWKWHVRQGKQIKFYLSFMSVSFGAIVVLPLNLKIIVLIFALIAGYKIQQGIWKAFINHPFARNINKINEDVMARAKRLAFKATWLIPMSTLKVLTIILFLLNIFKL